MKTPYREGWGVSIIPIWAHDEDEHPGRVTEIIVDVVRLSPQTEIIVGGVICVEAKSGGFVPMTSFEKLEDLPYDDTHDLRDRWFATKREAEEHACYTERRWSNPSPWECFVQVS